MGKALGLLPSWYWPEGVQRYLAAPRVPIYELAVNRWARRYGADPALVSGEAALSFGELDALCARVANAIGQRFPPGAARVALAVRDGQVFAPLFLGLLRANATVLALDGSDDAALREFEPSLVISDLAGIPGEPPSSLLADGVRGASSRLAAIDVTRAAVALPARDGLVWHSHVSLMSAAMAFATFVALDAKTRLLVVRPPGSWEGLVGLLAPLQAGTATLACDSRELTGTTVLVTGLEPSIVWLDRAMADQLLQASDSLTSALRRAHPLVYVTVSAPFPKHLRRALRHRLRGHVMTVYGGPECGPIAANHVSWYLDDSVGIPMVGVDILALNPDTGQPSELLWPVLSYARIGAKTQAVALNRRFAREGSVEIDGSWYATDDDGVLDANGQLFLRERRDKSPRA